MPFANTPVYCIYDVLLEAYSMIWLRSCRSLVVKMRDCHLTNPVLSCWARSDLQTNQPGQLSLYSLRRR